MGDIVNLPPKPPPPDDHDELPVACPTCENRTYHLWENGELSCTACGVVVNPYAADE